jgi:hypothetical protein
MGSGTAPNLQDGQAAYPITHKVFEAARPRDKKATNLIWDSDLKAIFIVDKDDESLALKAMADLRAERDRLLFASDPKVLPDYPDPNGLREAWIAYRQALKDLPINTSDPFNPVWPMPLD